MPLKEKIEEDFKQAMRKKDALRVSCFRMMKAAIKNKEIEKRTPGDDPMVLGVLQTLAKQRKESIEQFKMGGRQDLVEKEEAELKLIESYLPKQMPEEELIRLIEESIQEAKAQGPKDMGKVMQLVMSKAQGRADGKIISQWVKKKL